MLILRKRQSGMSLIEIIISMTVLVIVMALGIPSFYEWVQNQQIRAGAEAIMNGLQLARSEAIQRNLTVKFVVAPPGTGWTVSESTSGTQIQARNAAEGTSNAVVTVTPLGATTVTFAPLGGVTANADSSDTLTQVDVTNVVLTSTAARPIRIVVTGGGSTRMCDPAATIATTDPRHC